MNYLFYNYWPVCSGKVSIKCYEYFSKHNKYEGNVNKKGHSLAGGRYTAFNRAYSVEN